MSLSKKELEHATTLIAQAEAAKAALTKFFTAAKELHGVAKDKFLVHQITQQALSSAGVPKLLENIKGIQEASMNTAPRSQPVTTEAVGIGEFLVPSYDYKPTTKLTPKMTNKGNDADFLMILRAAVELRVPGVVEKRLSGGFTDPITGPKLLEACAGLAYLDQEATWSVTKHK